jgi:hypothetical protein
MNRAARAPTRKLSAPSVDFDTLLPTIERQIVFRFRRVPVPFREDVLQEALVAAFVAYRRLADRGRHDQIFATPLAQFAVCRVRDGRRVGSPGNRLDASCPFVARRRGFRFDTHRPLRPAHPSLDLDGHSLFRGIRAGSSRLPSRFSQMAVHSDAPRPAAYSSLGMR